MAKATEKITKVVIGTAVKPLSKSTSKSIVKKTVAKQGIVKSGIRIKGLDSANDNTSLMWYKTTEQTRFVLNNALAGYAELLMAEREKADPSPGRIVELTEKINNVKRITRDPGSFQSIENMQRLTKQFIAVK